MAEAHFLSERDKRILQEIIDEVRKNRVNTENRPKTPHTLGTTPEVYVALVPEGGIGALTDRAGIDMDEPNYAECNVYQINEDDGELIQVPELSRRVYNLSTAAIEADTWILAVRDKFGFWFASVAVGGGGDETKFIKVLSETPDSGGLWSGRIQIENADGTLSDTGDSVWFRESNVLSRIEQDKIYLSNPTGVYESLTVYTSTERKLTVRRSDGTQSFGPNIHTIEFDIPTQWDITRPSAGIVRIKPNGYSGTRIVCEADGSPRSWFFVGGWLMTVT